MQVDPDNLSAALHKSSSSGIVDTVLLSVTAVALAFAIWGRRIIPALGTGWRFVRDLLTNNDALRGRMTVNEQAQAGIQQELHAIRSQVAVIMATLAPPGKRSNRDILEDLEMKSVIAAARWKNFVDRDATPRFECDNSGACTYANEALCQLYGMSLERMLGNGWTEAVAGDERRDVFEAWDNAVKAHLPYDHEHNVQTPSGRLRVYTQAHAVTLDGVPILYMGTVTRVPPK